MERVGGFGGKADQLNAYYTATGDADWFNEDLARYRALSAGDVAPPRQRFLPLGRAGGVDRLRRPEERRTDTVAVRNRHDA